MRATVVTVSLAITTAMLSGCTGQGSPSNPAMLELESNGYAFCEECWVDVGGSSYYQVQGPRPRHLQFFEHAFGSGVGVVVTVLEAQAELDLACEDATSCVGSAGNSEGLSSFMLDVGPPQECGEVNEIRDTYFRVDYDDSGPGNVEQVFDVTVDMRTELTPPEWTACN